MSSVPIAIYRSTWWIKSNQSLARCKDVVGFRGARVRISRRSPDLALHMLVAHELQSCATV